MISPDSHPQVYLIGAGPGDPGLITVRGAHLLELADVVVYDYLASPRLLRYCPRAEKIYVGKKAASHQVSQAQINDLLVERARSGKCVVRLKGGDPFVFGRGGEECEALVAAGIRFEVVPGITSAIAAAAYAGIPVTHRDFNSSFTLVTGHAREEASAHGAGPGAVDGADGGLNFEVLAKLPCVAFYMGFESLPRLCQKLLEHGMSPAMPAATIQWGTTPRQRTVASTLAELPAAVARAGLSSPAITIFGKVVQLRGTLDWFERRPLFGQTVIVTRTRQQISELSQQLEALGANVIEAPTIHLAEPEDPAVVDAALSRADEYDWIVFTSANGVSHAKERLLRRGMDARAFGHARVAAIGDATAAAIERELCLKVNLCPRQFVAEALADELIARGFVDGSRFLLLRADIARPILRDRLVEAGAAAVDDVAIYRTLLAPELPAEVVHALEEGNPWITFTSSSTVRNFVQLLGASALPLLGRARIASIGPVTTSTLRELALAPTVQAATFNIAGLLTAIQSPIPL